ncbi:MAG: hypothetical protein ACFFD1_14730 [Candidatus Thorarchaeota archaeon]
MDIINLQTYCIYCKQKLSNTEQTFHRDCHSEVVDFNHIPEVKIDANNYQTQLLILILANTRLQLHEALILRKKNFDLRNKVINFRNKKFDLPEEECEKILTIFNDFSVQDSIFSINFSFPSKFTFKKLIYGRT